MVLVYTKRQALRLNFSFVDLETVVSVFLIIESSDDRAFYFFAEWRHVA